MSADFHRQAERRIEAAERLAAAGHAAEAADAYREAARLEREAFDSVPADRSKTRGTLAMSAVSLLLQSGDHAAARKLAHRFLSLGDMAPDAEDFLFHVALDSARTHQAAREQRALGRDSYLVALRGPAIQTGGMAPLDTVLLKMEQFRNYAVRIGEWVARSPFRLSGGVPEELRGLLAPLVSPAAVGSYEFELYLQAPLQLELFNRRGSELADATIEEFGTVLDLAASDPAHLVGHVADENYRRLFLKMVRGLTPSGKDLVEIEVSRSRPAVSLVLRPEMRRGIQHQITIERPETQTREEARTGVLRGLNLEANWLLLVQEGRPVRYRIQPGQVFDDVVGPYVNHRVSLRGLVNRSGNFSVIDIVEPEDPEPLPRAEGTDSD